MLEGNFHVVMTLTFSTPPGMSREQAAKMLAQGGVNIPVGLLQYCKRCDVNVVDVTPPEGGTLKLT